MKLFEYQAKALLQQAGLPVPRGQVVTSREQVAPALEQLGMRTGVVKAQAYTGGRGKAGGIKLFKSPEEAADLTQKMIGMTLVTHQTGPQGVKVPSVLLEEASEIRRELYVAITLDRAKVNPVIMLSPEGGMDIEEVAANRPEKILKIHPPFGKPIPKEMLSQGASFLGLDAKQAEQFGDVLEMLYRVFRERDCSLLEINPLIVNGEGKLAILDCKFSIDENAEFRQTDTGGDPHGEHTPEEVEASKWGLSYIKLDGNIGCMVNGAGLAMATMDTIAYYGGQPANFLDVGGSASEEAITKAFEIITKDPNVKTILVNIFGGIMHCDRIARGIINAVNNTGLKVPLIVRLEGNRVAEGKAVIAESSLNLISASDLDDAARKAVEAAKGAK